MNEHIIEEQAGFLGRNTLVITTLISVTFFKQGYNNCCRPAFWKNSIKQL
jgi:hypothetical protein